MIPEPLGDPFASRSSENLGNDLDDEFLVRFVARPTPVPNKVVRFHWFSRSITIVGQKSVLSLLEPVLKSLAKRL